MAKVASAHRRPPVQSSDAQLTFGPSVVVKGQPTVQPIADAWILTLVGRAIDRVMQRKEAAILMSIDQALMTRQLSGDGHLSVRRLGLMPEDFWRALIDELRAHFHMDDDAERLMRAIDGVRAGLSVIAEVAVKAVTK